jgi:hypothetical protein
MRLLARLIITMVTLVTLIGSNVSRLEQHAHPQ